MSKLAIDRLDSVWKVNPAKERLPRWQCRWVLQKTDEKGGPSSMSKRKDQTFEQSTGSDLRKTDFNPLYQPLISNFSYAKRKTTKKLWLHNATAKQLIKTHVFPKHFKSGSKANLYKVERPFGTYTMTRRKCFDLTVNKAQTFKIYIFWLHYPGLLTLVKD